MRGSSEVDTKNNRCHEIGFHALKARRIGVRIPKPEGLARRRHSPPFRTTLEGGFSYKILPAPRMPRMVPRLADAAATIQKRIVTFVSGQPNASKW